MTGGEGGLPRFREPIRSALTPRRRSSLSALNSLVGRDSVEPASFVARPIGSTESLPTRNDVRYVASSFSLMEKVRMRVAFCRLRSAPAPFMTLTSDPRGPHLNSFPLERKSAAMPNAVHGIPRGIPNRGSTRQAGSCAALALRTAKRLQKFWSRLFCSPPPRSANPPRKPAAPRCRRRTIVRSPPLSPAALESLPCLSLSARHSTPANLLRPADRSLS